MVTKYSYKIQRHVGYRLISHAEHDVVEMAATLKQVRSIKTERGNLINYITISCLVEYDVTKNYKLQLQWVLMMEQQY